MIVTYILNKTKQLNYKSLIQDNLIMMNCSNGLIGRFTLFVYIKKIGKKNMVNIRLNPIDNINYYIFVKITIELDNNATPMERDDVFLTSMYVQNETNLIGSFNIFTNFNTVVSI